MRLPGTGKLWPLCLLAAIAACKGKYENRDIYHKVERKQPMTQGPFALSDDEFWGEPLNHLDKASAPYDMKPKRALLVDGPKEVDLQARESLPVPVYYLHSAADAFSFAFQNVAIVVAARAEDRAVFCNMAAPRITVPMEPPEGKPSPTTFFGDSKVLNLKERGLPWKPGTWFVNVIVRDLVSNRVQIHLGEPASKYKDPEVEKFLKSQKYPPPAPVSPEPGKPLPHYQLYGRSPAVPDSQGIALSVDRVIVTRRGNRGELSASFRLAPLPGELVPGASGDGPKAVIPITLIVTGTENSFPLPFTVRAPAYGNAGDTELTGHFALDLFDVPQFDARAQTYFVYAFAGEVMAGPAAMALVSEEMTHQR
jgi:hypothetical protein